MKALKVLRAGLTKSQRVIKNHKSKKDRQYNGQSKKDKGTNNHLQNITQKTDIEQHEPH